MSLSIKSYFSKFLDGFKAGQLNDAKRERPAGFDMGSHLHLTNPISFCGSPQLAIGIKGRIQTLHTSIHRLKVKLTKNLSTRRLPAPALPERKAALGQQHETNRLFLATGRAPLNALPDALLVHIFQQMEYSQLPKLLCLNKRCRKVLLNNYHLIMSYPMVITSRYEHCLLALDFPTSWADNQSTYFYTALHRVIMHQDCFLVVADILTDEFFGFWEVSAARNPMLKRIYNDMTKGAGWEAVRNEMLARLVNQAWKRGVKNERAVKYLEWLVPVGYEWIATAGQRADKDKEIDISVYVSNSSAGGDNNDNLQKRRSEDSTMVSRDVDILRQAVHYALDPIVREDISYSFPTVRLEALHPTQILELMKIEVAPWSWRHEDQVEEIKKVHMGSFKAAEQLDSYREGWERMREAIDLVLKVENL
ncbi:hypothetical protein DRE_02602 [Drechslerella stenobrocha 248]|uniref:F-box domain-containing protein n=1 Tax=Drechslerella stenobrocha 248 TaxID=1043628 RepID=W7I6X7_9PEZI|nr:hypothetical protein DRE_02602 [Drechslerella stenobrocha 248]